MKRLTKQQLINTLRDNIQVILHEHQVAAQQNHIIQQEPNSLKQGAGRMNIYKKILNI